MKRHIQMIRCRTGRDQLACCVAMVAGIEFYEAQNSASRLGIGADDWEIAFAARVLAWHRVVTATCYYVDLEVPGLYIAQVADLNAVGRLSWVVLDARSGPDAVVLDPNRGLRDRDYYGLNTGLPRSAAPPQLHPLFDIGKGLYCERLGEPV